MAQYACHDCDATFTAPTDTETVRCPGCGNMAGRQPEPVMLRAYPDCERCGDTGLDPEAANEPCADCRPTDPSSPPDQNLRDRIAEALAPYFANFSDWETAKINAGEAADAVLAVLHGLTLRELEQLARPNTPPSRPEPRIPDHTVNEEEAPAPVRQRADCTELEWAVQERARFEKLYTRESVRADLAEQRADTAARDADIYQQRLERLSDGYTRERKRAEAHRTALSEALGLGTGAPWDAIHDRATELGLPPLAEDPVAQRLGLVPPPADRAAVLLEAAAAAASGDVEFNTEAIDAAAANAGPFALVAYVQLAVSEHLRRLAAEAQQPDTAAPAAAGPGRAADTRSDEEA